MRAAVLILLGLAGCDTVLPAAQRALEVQGWKVASVYQDEKMSGLPCRGRTLARLGVERGPKRTTAYVCDDRTIAMRRPE